MNAQGDHLGWAWREHSPHAYAHLMEDARYTGMDGSEVTHWMPIHPPAAGECGHQMGTTETKSQRGEQQDAP